MVVMRSQPSDLFVWQLDLFLLERERERERESFGDEECFARVVI